MNRKSSWKVSGPTEAALETARSWRTAWCVIPALMTVFAATCLSGCLTPSKAQPRDTASAAAQTKSGGLKAALADPELTGAELYSINCNRCHQERYPTERTGAQWKTIMLHMQVRANIPVNQAKLILQYLQENSGR